MASPPRRCRARGAVRQRRSRRRAVLTRRRLTRSAGHGDHACGARAARNAACRSVRRPSRRCVAWLPVRGDVVAADAGAAVVRQRARSAAVAARRSTHHRPSQPTSDASSRAAAQLRNAPAGWWGRPPRGTRSAGPQRRGHHAALHTRQQTTPSSRLHGSASPSMKRDNDIEHWWQRWLEVARSRRPRPSHRSLLATGQVRCRSCRCRSCPTASIRATSSARGCSGSSTLSSASTAVSWREVRDVRCAAHSWRRVRRICDRSTGCLVRCAAALAKSRLRSPSWRVVTVGRRPTPSCRRT